MELEALDAEIGDEPAGFAGAHLALGRVDGGERDQDVVVRGRDLGHLLVLVAAVTGLALGIDREDNGGDVLLPVMGGGLLDRGRVLPRGAEVFGHGRLEVVVAVVRVAAARLLGVGMDVDGTDVGEIDHGCPSRRITAGSSLR